MNMGMGTFDVLVYFFAEVLLPFLFLLHDCVHFL